MSLYEEPRRQGAAASRRVSDQPAFRLLSRLLRDDKTAAPSKLEKRWREEVKNDPDYLDDVLTYAFTNYYNALRQDTPTNLRARPRPPEREIYAKEQAAEVKKIVEKIEEAIQVKTLKSLLLPNGKIAWEATCGELAKCSGFLGAVAKLGKPADLVSSLPLSKLKKIPNI